MSKEKFNLIQELEKKSAILTGKKRLALIGQGDFPAGNNLTRSTMNIKHKTQHICIHNPEFPMIYDGKENVVGEYSSHYYKTDKNYEVIHISKKFSGIMNGKTNYALYFLYCKEDDSYKVIQRKEVENLTENFGFTYNNDYIDTSEVGDKIPKGTVLYASTSYDDYGNTSIGVNGRIIQAIHPAVQDDAIMISESFANKMISDNIKSITIPIDSNTILLNIYGKKGKYQGLPDIGDHITNGIIAATRIKRESRILSDMRDISLQNINYTSDQKFYGAGEVIDINIYSNNPNMKINKVNRQLIQYYNDQKWFYTDVYKICKKIIRTKAKHIDREIFHWKRLAMNHLDEQAVWTFNDNEFSNMLVEILLRKTEKLNIGRKIVGRHGNKTVICKILPDDEMPYLTTETYTDEYQIVHPKGVRERVDLVTNGLAVPNRTIPIVLEEGSVSFVLDRARKHAATLKTPEEQKEFLFDILRILNPKETKEWEELYDRLSERDKRIFIKDCISIDRNGLLMTSNGVYYRWEAFSDEHKLRDALVTIYQRYGDIIQPYNIFIPKPKWGKDIYIGKDCIGYQYIMVLKQNGEKGFSVRSAGSISDESLPAKSNVNKIGKLWHSEKPIRFGEWKCFMLTVNFFNCGNEGFESLSA